MQTKFSNYNLKCCLFSFRFRSGKDDKYITFLKSQKNKTEFLRKAIDRELEASH